MGDLNSGIVMIERHDRFKMSGGWMEPPVARLFVIEDGLITLRPAAPNCATMGR